MTEAVKIADVKGEIRDDFFHINKINVFYFYFRLKPEGKRSMERPLNRYGIIPGVQIVGTQR
jgi:hypothetical protein